MTCMRRFIIHKSLGPLLSTCLPEIRACPGPHSRPKRIPRSYPSLKTPPFRGFWTKKHPFFQPKSLILRSNKFKTPLFFRQNATFFRNVSCSTLFCESENICNCVKLKTFFYVRRIFHYFKLWLKLKYIYA